MDFNEYQRLASRTDNPDTTQDERQLNAVLGLNGEAGEIADLYKKSLFQGHKLDITEIVKELGDVLWYIAQMATALNVPLERIAEINIEKLKIRYPNGFSVEESIHREVE